MLDELGRAFRLLAGNPRSGHSRPDIRDDSALRFWTVYSYLIAYLPAERPLFIVRILHGARSPAELRAEMRLLDEGPGSP